MKTSMFLEKFMEELPKNFSETVKESIEQKRYNKEEIFDNYLFDNGLYDYDSNIKPQELVKVFELMDSVFYNTLEKMHSYKKLLYEIDNHYIYNNHLKTFLDIDAYLAIMDKFNLSFEEIANELIEHNIKIYLNDVDFFRTRINEINSEKLIQFINTNPHKLVNHESVLKAFLEVDNAFQVNSKIIAKWDK